MKVEACNKSFNDKKVLDLPAFELDEGCITAVVGANGSGKSTLARILAGLERPDERSWKRPTDNVGYMPQKSFAFRMTTRKNIALNGDDPQRMEHLVDALGLEPLLDHRAKKLSGGETARMALARILMGDFDLLILDEPSASMDMEATLAAEQLLRDYVEHTGAIIVLITHSIQQARRVADKVILLDKGLLVEHTGIHDLIEHPQDERTVRFLQFFGV